MRDTDKDWQRIGASEPFWGVCSAPEFKADAMDDAERQRFYASGENDIARVRQRMISLYGAFEPDVALDFGCGVGRLVFPMASIAGSAYGIDVSRGMLERARERMDELGVANVTLQTTIPDVGLDWVNSYIVLQHIPPARGLEILADLLDRLSPGGYLSIQFVHSNRRMRESRLWRYLYRFADLAPVGTIRMFEYDLGQVTDLLLAHGVAPTAFYPTNHGGHYGVWVFARKDEA